MLDRIGSELDTGNVVIFNGGIDTVRLEVGRIISLTPQKVRIKYVQKWEDRHGNTHSHEKEVLKFPKDVCKLNGEDAIAYILKEGL